jgi:hypothetical protein
MPRVRTDYLFLCFKNVEFIYERYGIYISNMSWH